MQEIQSYSPLSELPHFNTGNCNLCSFYNQLALSICELCGFDNIKQTKSETYKSFINPEIRKVKLLKGISQTVESKMSQISLCQKCLFADIEEVAKCQNCKDTLYGTREKKYFKIWVCPVCEYTKKQKGQVLKHLHFCKIKEIQRIIKKKKEKQKVKVVLPSTPIIPPVYNPITPPINQYQLVLPDQDPVQIRTLISFQQFSPDILIDLHKQNLYYLNDNFRKLNNRAQQKIQQTIIRIGNQKQDLFILQDYFQNKVPIIIHVHVTKHFQFFVKDTHYRSQFQTNKSSGTLSRTSRITWQSRMFNKKYDEASDFDRVKYGVINLTNDRSGVNICRSYGLSYFILKKQVRKRCTFTQMDSSHVSSIMGSLKYHNHVIQKFSDHELKIIIEAAKGNSSPSNTICSTYKQLQIHGSIQFDRDIQKLCVGSTEISDPKYLELVKQFSEKFNVPYEVI